MKRPAEQPDFKRTKSHALLTFLDARETGNVTRAAMVEFKPQSTGGFASGVRDQVKKELAKDKSNEAASEKGGDYTYQPGDEVFAVSGDRQQIQQFFAALRDYLAARSPVLGGPVKKPAPNRPRIPIFLRRFAESAEMRTAFGRSTRGRAQGLGQLRFLVVLRARR